MFTNEKDALSEIANDLSGEPEILKIVAFGSRVRGDFSGDSDLDVFVLVENKTASVRDRIIDVFYQYELARNIPFSVTILSKEEFEFNDKLGSPFIKSIKEEGVVIYDYYQRGKEVALKIQA